MNTTTTKQNSERLQYIMRRHHIGVGEVADMLERADKTVRQWIAGTRPIPDALIEKLREKLATRPRERDQRTERLFKVMESANLSTHDVADILGRSDQTVRIWRCEAKIIPEHTLHFLETHVAKALGE
jgi:plasmid maintenance system antidote protein VapI